VGGRVAITPAQRLPDAYSGQTENGIEACCYIGAGAKILGAIRVGNRCQIGAGAVVIRDVPDRGIVVGVPARLIGSTAADYRAIRI
jgi:serine acetyltransferase